MDIYFMSFITSDFNFYAIQEKYDDIDKNLEIEMKEIMDKILMAIYIKIDTDCGDFLEQFNQLDVSFDIESTYNNYKKSYDVKTPSIKITNRKEKEENKGQINHYLHYNLNTVIDNEIKDLSKIYHIYSFFKKPDEKISFSLNACQYYELYKEIEEIYNGKENIFPNHFTTYDALILIEEQLNKVKIALFLDLVSKYGNDISIQLKRDINNNLSKELVFPLEHLNNIKKEWAYNKLIELNQHLSIDKETINLKTFEQISIKNISDYYKRQSISFFSL